MLERYSGISSTSANRGRKRNGLLKQAQTQPHRVTEADVEPILKMLK
jgi:hypothetical protein